MKFALRAMACVAFVACLLKQAVFGPVPEGSANLQIVFRWGVVLRSLEAYGIRSNSSWLPQNAHGEIA